MRRLSFVCTIVVLALLVIAASILASSVADRPLGYVETPRVLSSATTIPISYSPLFTLHIKYDKKISSA